MHGAQDHQFSIALLHVLTSKEISQNWNIAQSWHLAGDISDAIVHQAGNHKTLSILKLELGLRLSRAERWDGEARNGESICEVQLAYFWNYLKVNVVVRHDHGSEFQLHAEFPELDGHSGKTLSRLNNGERELATGQETCFLAIDCDQVRFSQNLQQILLLQRFDDGADINVGSRDK